MKVRELQIANCKLQIENREDARGGRAVETSRPMMPRVRQLKICNLQFAICNFRPRRGISLTEVLISMGILTVGLLGVAALFPVGGYYMHKATIADNGSAIAQSVMNDIVAKGLLNPQAWMVMNPVAGFGNPASTTFGADAPLSPTGAPVRGSFTRPFALALSEAFNQTTASTDATLIGKQFGSAYVIDPMGVARMAYPTGTSGDQTWNIAAAAFPANVTGVIPPQFYGTWQPWGTMWPIRRVTLQQPLTGWQMDAETAEHNFRGGDDLTTDFPPRADRPASQNWEIADLPTTGRTPLARVSRGDYSWLITVVPTTNAARDGLARNPEGFEYDVSVVVFYKRVLPPGALSVFGSTSGRNQFLQAMGENERAVKAIVLSTGLNGGEILLERLPGDANSPFDQLKTSEWIMVCGPHPNSNSVATSPTQSTGAPRFVLNWYQVLAIDGKDKRLNSQGTETPAPPTSDPERRLVTVRGPQWPWDPGTTSANNVCAGICRGAVAVHRKTLRLENSRGGSYGSGTTLVVPPGVDPPQWKVGG